VRRLRAGRNTRLPGGSPEKRPSTLTVRYDAASLIQGTHAMRCMGRVPGLAAAGLWHPPLQFSTVPGVPSNLSGAPISGFKTFTGTGIEHHVGVTAGLFWRF